MYKRYIKYSLNDRISKLIELNNKYVTLFEKK